MITGAQIRAARALLRWSAERLAKEAKLGVATVRRADLADDVTPTMTAANLEAVQRALEAAGIQFIPENGGGGGVRYQKRRAERKASQGNSEEGSDGP